MSNETACISFHPGTQLNGNKRLSLSDHFREDLSKNSPSKQITELRQKSYVEIRNQMRQSFNDAKSTIYSNVLSDVEQFVNLHQKQANIIQKEQWNGRLLPIGVVVLGQNVADHDDIFDNLVERFENQPEKPVVFRMRSRASNNLRSCIQTVVRGCITAIGTGDVDTVKSVQTFRQFLNFYKNLETGDEAPVTKKRRKNKQQKRDMKEKPNLILILEDFEGFDGSVLNDLIGLCAKYLKHGLPLILVMGVATTLLAVQTVLSRETMGVVRIENFKFSSPRQQLATILDSVLLNELIPFKVDHKMLKMLIGRFMNENYSIEEFMKTVQLCLLQFILTNPLSLFCCCEEEVDTRISAMNGPIISIIRKYPNFQEFRANNKDISTEKQAVQECLRLLTNFHYRYYRLLPVLYSLVKDLPNPFKENQSTWIGSNIENLHLSLISDCEVRKSDFEYCSSLWASWSVDELIDQIGRALEIFSKLLNQHSVDVFKEFQDYLHKFEHMDELQAAEDEKHKETRKKEAESIPESKERNKRVKLHEVQEKLRSDIRRNRERNVFHRERQHFIRYVLQVIDESMKSPQVLVMYDALYATYTDEFRQNALANPRNVVSLALGHPSVYLGENDIQVDCAVGFDLFQLLTEGNQSLSLNHWLSYFIERMDLQEMDDEKRNAQFYAMVGQLELLGCLKPSSIKNTNVVQKLFWPLMGTANTLS